MTKMSFAYYPLYHESRQAKRQSTSMASSPTTDFEAMRQEKPYALRILSTLPQSTPNRSNTTITTPSPITAFDVMLDAELARLNRGSVSFTYCPLYHETRHNQSQGNTMTPSPIAAFEAMLDTELVSTIHKKRVNKQHQTPDPFRCVKRQENERPPIQPQRMPGTLTSQNVNLQIALRRPPRLCIRENDIAPINTRRPPKLCISNNVKKNITSQRTPAPQTQ
jgi:hypothetical protein